jgi:lantibiotic leader peptide-processing serine protease
MPTSVRRALALFGAAAIAGCLLVAAPVAIAGESQTYLVLYKGLAVPSDAAARIQAAGGTLVAQYDAIGVAVARSGSSTFRSTIRADGRVSEAALTSKVVVRVDGAVDNTADATPNIPATDSDSLSGLQWDMVQIHTPEAHAITGGSPSVVVADLDTGLDFTHPDLAPNYDAADSADCSSGTATPLLPGNDQFGHGTHTAGTIAAAANGIGIVGVAPNVKIAGIKTSTDSGFFFPEMVVCAFMWAGTHGIDVTNNSYFADPWLFNCKNDSEQRAIFAAEQRAIKFAISKGTAVVAAEGNFEDDLAHVTQDVISPDTGPGTVRDISNACAVIPVEVPGVIGVTANGNLGIKSFYSNYGVGVTQVVAPGGDSILQRTAAAPNGRVLSTYPSYLPCSRKVVDPSGATYCYLQGTSMASPHVTGLVALIESAFPGISVGAATARLTSTADPIACPDISPYAPFPSTSNGAPQVCQGSTGYNSFNGHGQVNALSAVSP